MPVSTAGFVRAKAKVFSASERGFQQLEAQLSPYIDPTGELRVGRRLRNADLPEEGRHPAILSAKHPLSVLLAEACHLQLLHAGPQLWYPDYIQQLQARAKHSNQSASDH
uniref:Uncharacterized protein n=1 Tax=Anopheles epiroticus TaxID=199890 RepID=A0A182NZG3_9DIPT